MLASLLLIGTLITATSQPSPKFASTHLQLSAPAGSASTDDASHVTSDNTNTSWPTSSSTECFKLDKKHETCLFYNLIYDIKARVFRHFGAHQGVEGLPPQTQLNVGVMKSRQVNFRIRYSEDEQMPPQHEVCEEAELVYLHGLYNSHSFGHVVRDNFQTMYWTLMRLKREYAPFKLVTVERYKKSTEVPRVVKKYSKWASTSTDTWENFVSKCKKPYIMFRELVSGYGAIIYTRPPWGCYPLNFLVQREAAYRKMNYQLRPARMMPRVHILFGDKTIADSRRITNIDELLPTMRIRFPQARFHSEILSELSNEKQLLLLSQTSIFISPVGSSSFRLIYLPTGAHVILVGAPEKDANGDGLVPAFSEVTECWHNLKYLSFSSYHVTEKNESVPRFERLMHGWKPESPEQVEQFRMWDSDTVLDPEKLGNLIEEALTGLRERKEAAKAAQQKQTSA